VTSSTGNTKVLLPGSKTIAISKVKAGQKVLATDPYTGKTAARQVAQVIKHHGVHAMALIALLGGGLIHATAHHPIYDASTKTFTYAASLHPGDKLLEPSGSTIKITSVRDYTADLTAYNLNVTGIHTYYALAGTTPVLVHNSCGPAPEAAPESPSIASGNYRGRYNAQLARDGMPRLPDSWDAHHIIPQMYRDHPEFQGFDFNAPSNTVGVPGNRAGLGVANIHNQVTQMWADFAEANPGASRSMIEGFASRVQAAFEGYWWR